MHQDIKERWVEALQSGNFTQGRGLLRSTDDRYCCLGVLCEVYRRYNHNNVDWTLRKSSTYYDFMVGEEISSVALPKTIMAWAELNERQEGVLMNLNDRDVPFDAIANVIDSFA
jgi:hypothetical protein